MLFDILLSFLIAGMVLAFIWALRGLLVTPVAVGRGARVAAVVRISGRAETLEQTVDGLLWLAKNGTLPMDIILADAGMDEETRLTARILADKCGAVKLCGLEEISAYLQ
jgi:hypothetical protein